MTESFVPPRIQNLGPSPVRAALDELLSRHPHFDLVSIEWQIETGWSIDPNERTRTSMQQHIGPWVLVRLGQPSEDFDRVPAWAVWEFAIWKTTGALYSMRDGAVSDEPIWKP